MVLVPAAVGEDHPRAARPARLTPLQVIEIDDPDDARLVDYQSLTDVALRRVLEPAGGLFIAEGALVIRRALDAGYRLRSVVMSPQWLDRTADALVGSDAPIYLAPEPVLEALTGFHVHRGALASVHRRPLPTVADLLASGRRLVVVEDIVNHTNLGAIFRAAAALGMDGLLISPSSADPLYRRSVRVSMGAVFALPYGRAETWPGVIDEIRSAGFTVAALTPAADGVPLDHVRSEEHVRLAVLLGTEGPGLSDAAIARSDLAVRIPMAAGVDSLNVAAAAAVAFWELGRRRDSTRVSGC